MVRFIIDSYAWIEYFIGSKKGEVLKNLLSESKYEFYTVECCLAEICGWGLKNNLDFEKLLKIIKANSLVIPICEKDWILAGKTRHEQRKTQNDFGLIDSVILVKQKEYSAKVVSGDLHFKELKDVLFLD